MSNTLISKQLGKWTSFLSHRENFSYLQTASQTCKPFKPAIPSRKRVGTGTEYRERSSRRMTSALRIRFVMAHPPLCSAGWRPRPSLRGCTFHSQVAAVFTLARGQTILFVVPVASLTFALRGCAEDGAVCLAALGSNCVRMCSALASRSWRP